MKRATMVLAVLALGLAPAAFGAKPPKTGSSSATITGTPNPVVYGSSITISGQATGKKNTGATADLQANAFPYSGFKQVATTTTTSTGAYSFKTAPGINTVYRVIVHTAPAATSPNLTVKVKVRVTLAVSTTHPRVGQLVRFSGSVFPAYNGKLVLIQRRSSTGWKTVTKATLTAAKPLNSVPRSSYSKRIRIKTSGTYRVEFNPADNARLANTSRTRSLKVHS